MSYTIPDHPDAATYRNRIPTWEDLSQNLRDAYTLDHKIPVHSYYLRDNATANPPVWSRSLLETAIHEAEKNGELPVAARSYYPGDVFAMYRMLELYSVKDKEVLVIGSLKPWLEAIALSRGARHVTTVDFSPPQIDPAFQAAHPGKLSSIHVSELDGTRKKYDVVMSFSSLEHDGLGRYGDPIHPNGDLERMKAIRSFVQPATGIFLLSVPIGRDLLCYNAHRIYGPIRFPLLTEAQGWDVLGVDWNRVQYGHVSRDTLFDVNERSGAFQPIWALRPKNLL